MILLSYLVSEFTYFFSASFVLYTGFLVHEAPEGCTLPSIQERHREEISSQGSRGILTRVQRTVCTAGHSSTLRRNLETLNHCTCYCLVWDDDCHAITITVSTHPFISREYSWHWFFHLVCHLFIIKHPHIGGYISYFLYAIIKYQAKASQGRKDYISGF